GWRTCRLRRARVRPVGRGGRGRRATRASGEARRRACGFLLGCSPPTRVPPAVEQGQRIRPDEKSGKTGYRGRRKVTPPAPPPPAPRKNRSADPWGEGNGNCGASRAAHFAASVDPRRPRRV